MQFILEGWNSVVFAPRDLYFKATETSHKSEFRKLDVLIFVLLKYFLLSFGRSSSTAWSLMKVTNEALEVTGC